MDELNREDLLRVIKRLIAETGLDGESLKDVYDRLDLSETFVLQEILVKGGVEQAVHKTISAAFLAGLENALRIVGAEYVVHPASVSCKARIIFVLKQRIEEIRAGMEAVPSEPGATGPEEVERKV